MDSNYKPDKIRRNVGKMSDVEKILSGIGGTASAITTIYLSSRYGLSEGIKDLGILLASITSVVTLAYVTSDIGSDSYKGNNW